MNGLTLYTSDMFICIYSLELTAHYHGNAHFKIGNCDCTYGEGLEYILTPYSPKITFTVYYIIANKWINIT